MDLVSKKVFVFGLDSFTGRHFAEYLANAGYEVFGSSRNGGEFVKCDITNKSEIKAILANFAPEYIINLAAISFVGHADNSAFYSINTVGAINILDALLELGQSPKKVILTSSAVVYGSQGKEVLDESMTPMPTNHYGASKYAMELMAKNYFDKLNILITRPFNYTGVWQTNDFLIPKIVSHYKKNAKAIELGNLNVSREFNDIEFVCEVYKKLLESNATSDIVNICSGIGIKLLDVIDYMNKLAGYNIEIIVNPAFVRPNEIKSLTGSTARLTSAIGSLQNIGIATTLKRMFEYNE